MSDCCENMPPECCDMRGLLSFSLLWLLTKGDKYGQELADELERMRGNRPTPGTLYPALNDLEKAALVETRQEGRKKVYRLTGSGRKKVYRLTGSGREGAIKACEYFCQCYGDIFKEFAPK